MPTKRVVIGPRELSLDARADRLDVRDRLYSPPLGNLPALWPPPGEISKVLPAYAGNKLILDQGRDGACTGFGLAAVINYLLFVRGRALEENRVRRVSPAMLYQLARLYDEWPGEDYEGSSCRGALKGWHRHGVCRDGLWPYKFDSQGTRIHVHPAEDQEQRDDPDRNWDVDALACTLGVYYRIDVRSIVDMQAAIRHSGAIYVSGIVHEGWDVRARRQRLTSHGDLARIKPVGKPRQPGGHAYALVGYDAAGFVVQNSWGEEWGSYGFALLPYAEWIMFGRDAWTFTLGVPRLPPAGTGSRGNGSRTGIARSPRFLVSYDPGKDKEATERPVGLITADDALTRRYRGTTKAFLPLDADDAYRHAILLDRGLPIRNDITAEDAVAALNSAVLENPFVWLTANNNAKLLIYAHGGLNSEAASIRRIRVMAPYALANGIYPLFVTWRSGSLETLSDLVEEQAEKHGVLEEPEAAGWLDRVTDRSDRMLEAVLRGPGSALWGQMRSNAVRASDDARGGVRLMLPLLEQLNARLPKLEIHLMGHSAGAIVLGAMLARMKDAGLKAASARLFAPACTVRFALEYYVPAVRGKVLAAKDFHIHALSDENEQDDSVGPYRKSLLYLVSRSFEDDHKTPLLGMAKTFDPASAAPGAADDTWASDRLPEVADWQAFWGGLGTGATNLDILTARGVSDGVRINPPTHGSFDNSTDIVGRALGYIVNPAVPTKIRVERLDY